MDIALNPVSGVIRLQTQAVPTATNSPTDATTQAASAAQASVTPVSDTTVADTSKTNNEKIQASYEAAIQQISDSFKNTYAVSDKQFSIFKDATGKYITRYVSERDGSVTYSPAAPTLVRPPSTGKIAITA